MKDTEQKGVVVKWDYKSANDKSTLRGIASTFGGAPDKGQDIVDSGAFTKTIEQRVNKGKVLLREDHQMSAKHVLGLVDSAEEKGSELRIEATLSEAPSVQDTKVKMLEGLISGLSIGYIPIRTSFTREKGALVRHLEEIKLIEISVVENPMNTNTRITTVKSLPFADLPFAPLDTPWVPQEAALRVAKLENVTTQRKAFALFDTTAETFNEACAVQIADVIDGELKVVPKALHNAALSVLLKEEGADEYKDLLSKYYHKLNEAPPWDGKSLEQVLLEAKAGLIDLDCISAAHAQLSTFLEAESQGKSTESVSTDERKAEHLTRLKNIALEMK